MGLAENMNRRTFLKTASAAGAATIAIPSSRVIAQESSIKLGWVRSTANLMAAIAPDLGVAHGLRVESVNFNTAQDILTAITGGQLDVGLLTPVHLIRAIDTGVDVVQIAGNTRGNTGIVAATGLGLGEGDWEGLKAAAKKRKLKVGSSRGSINECLALASLKKNGINPSADLDILNILNFAQHPQALRAGEVDLVVTLEPLVALMVEQGIGTLFSYPYDTGAGDLNTNYVTSRKLANEEPDRVQAFVSTLAAASKELADPDTELAVAKKLTGLDKEVLKMALANCDYDIKNDVPQTVALAKIAADLNFTSKDVGSQVASNINDRFVDAAINGQ